MTFSKNLISLPTSVIHCYGHNLVLEPCHQVQASHSQITLTFPTSFLYDSFNSKGISVQFSSVQSLSHVRLFSTPWTAARQASLSITNSWSLLKLIKSVMPYNHLLLCRPLLLPPSIFPTIRVFSNESVLLIRWPKYWSFSFSISPSNGYSGLIF